MNDQKLIEKSKQLDVEIAAIPKDKFFTKRNVVIGFVLIMAPLLWLVYTVAGITESTNDAVKHEIPGLKKQIADRDEQISDYESITEQATAAIILLAHMLEDNGIEPPEIVISPED